MVITYIEFKANMGYERLCLKQNKTRKQILGLQM